MKPKPFPRTAMVKTRKTLRKAIHIFLKNYHFFTTTPSLLALPFSISILLSRSLLNFSSLRASIQNHLISLSYACHDFLPFSHFFYSKLSQAITSSILVLPFTLSSLLISKSLTIQFLRSYKKTPQSFIFNTYAPMLLTQLVNFLLIIAANSTCFFLLFISFNFISVLGISSSNTILVLHSSGTVLYCIILANTLTISNLALTSSGVEQNGGYLAILKACFLIEGRTSTALALAIPVYFALAGVEYLFQYRVMRTYYDAKKFDFSVVMEGIFIAYLYSIIIVIDNVISYVLFRSCKVAYSLDHDKRRWYFGLECQGYYEKVQIFEEIP